MYGYGIFISILDQDLSTHEGDRWSAAKETSLEFFFRGEILETV
jgi:hypothetical protein